MFSKFNHLAIGLISVFAVSSYAQIPLFDVQSNNSGLELNYDFISNDKEEKSMVLSSKYRAKILKKFDLTQQDLLKDAIRFAVEKTKVDKEDKVSCDLGLIDQLFTRLEENGFLLTKKEVKKYLEVLRANNSIDDIFYKLLIDLTDLKFDLIEASEANRYPSERDIKSSHKVFSKNNVEKIYSDFKKWPDEDSICSLGAWVKLKNKINPSKKKVSSKDIKRLNAKAYVSGFIKVETYRRLEYFREMELLEDRVIFTGGYLNKVLMAKNTLLPKTQRFYELPVEEEQKYASKKKNLFRNITMRESLYERYNDEQIVMLAGILRKASLRMGVDPDVQSSVPVISQDFTYQDERGEYVTITETYELENASDQYDYARRRMRMDMHKLQTFKSFSHVKITFEDVVMAALETGYITHEEVELVLTYDDLWNKETSKLMNALRFIFKIGGTAVFYLPPPYNILGGIGIALINAKIISKKDGSDYENPAALFN